MINDFPPNLEPGKVLVVDEDGVIVKAGSGAVRLFEIYPNIDLTKGSYL